jgi:hypothetical protein
VPVRAEAAVVAALQALDAGGLVAGEEEAVAHARDGGQVLVERIIHVPQRPPVREREGNLSDGFGGTVAGHGISWGVRA